MTTPLQLTLTTTGLDALVDAQAGTTDAIIIAEVGLTNSVFIAAPTLTAIPGEFKRVTAVAGQSASATIIHMVAQDSSNDVYSARGLGLYLADGTLFATYGQADAIVNKVSIASFLIAFDVAFLDAVDSAVSFGDAFFLYPPATESVKGVGFVATNALADAGVNDDTIMTPKKVKRLIDAAVTAILGQFSGMCMIWKGFVVDIPAGFALCDGTNGTPDMRDIFVIGAGGAYAVGDSGGAATHDHPITVEDHILTEAEMPAHRHLSVKDGISAAALTAANPISGQRTAGGDTEYILNGGAGDADVGLTSTTGGGVAHSHAADADIASSMPPYYARAWVMKL